MDAQKEAIVEFAKRNDIIITKWYAEQKTAAKRGRPQFVAMIKALRQGKAQGVVMHKIDRSARNFFDWAKIGQLSDAGIDIHFAVESLDFRSRGGRLAANVQMAVAEDYIRNLKEEIRKGQIGRLKNGYYPFTAPLGYLDNGKGKLKTPDPKRAKLVQTLFELYATGTYSIRTLRTEMIRRGLTNRDGRPPANNLIERILGNPFYTGIISISATGQTYEGKHKPLISASLFKRVQEVKFGKRGKKFTRHNHIYRGLFQCAGCMRSMIPELQKGHVYYRCHRIDCPSNIIREDDIEKAVVDELRKLRLGPAEIEQLTHAVTAWAEEKYGGKGNQLTLQCELEKVDQRIENLTDALIDKHIEPDAYHKRHQALLIEKRELEEKVENLRDLQSAGDNVQRFLELVKSLAEYYQTVSPDEKREFVEYTVSNRTVKNKKVELEPSEWLIPVQNVTSVMDGALTPPNCRRVPDLQPCQIEALVVAAYSEEAKRFGAICRKYDKKFKRHEQSSEQ